MSLAALPVVMVNLGAEMCYVLEQRLMAQKVPAGKTNTVLAEIVRALTGERLMQALFLPSQLLSTTSTNLNQLGDPATPVRMLFSKLCSTTSIRLNEQSMEKLFDLMLMAFKYQLMTIRGGAAGLSTLTMNHIAALKMVCRGGDNAEKFPALLSRVELLETKVRQEIFERKGVTKGDLEDLRMQLLRFVQDRRVKISLFIQDGKQSANGTLCYDHCFEEPPSAAGGGATTAAAATTPGKIVYFGKNSAVLSRETFNLGDERMRIDGQQQQQGEGMGTKKVEVGCNMYDLTGVGITSGSASAAASHAHSLSLSLGRKSLENVISSLEQQQQQSDLTGTFIGHQSKQQPLKAAATFDTLSPLGSSPKSPPNNNSNNQQQSDAGFTDLSALANMLPPSSPNSKTAVSVVVGQEDNEGLQKLATDLESALAGCNTNHHTKDDDDDEEEEGEDSLGDLEELSKKAASLH